MSRYAWVITADHLADARAPQGTNQNAVGVIGPSGVTPDHELLLRGAASSNASDHVRAKADMHRFRLYDDDDQLYYEGIYLGDASSEDAFGPLDDFGLPNAGCTRIEYLYPNGTWRPL